MRYRGIFIADGTSDLPLADHLAALCLDNGADVSVTAIDPARLGPAGRTVAGRLKFLVDAGDQLDIVFVHRDAEAQPHQTRRDEIESGAASAGVTQPVVPVVPVRMTEAWLLLDEQAIRRVAGRPTGRSPLELPTPQEAERLADPKQRLLDTLVQASGTTGRRRGLFRRDFGRHRGTLLRQLDRSGPITKLGAWQRLCTDIEVAVRGLGAGR